MSPIYLFNKNGENMVLKSKNNTQDEIIEEIIEETTTGISFDDLEFEAEYVEQNSAKRFLTISGKESWYEPTWEKYGISDLEIGDEFTGRPELNIFENEGKSYNALRVRLMDDGEIVDLYVNFPKKDFPYVQGINKGFDFYRTCFDFIYGVLRWRDEHNVVNSDGEEVNNFKKVNFENFAKYVDQMTRVSIRITEGNPDSNYNSFIIYNME